jgi:hypothetical protein
MKQDDPAGRPPDRAAGSPKDWLKDDKFLAMVMSKISELTQNIQKLTGLMAQRQGLVPHLSNKTPSEKDTDARMKQAVAAEVKKTLDKLSDLPPYFRQHESMSTLELVTKAQEEKGWDGVEELAAKAARTRRSSPYL